MSKEYDVLKVNLPSKAEYLSTIRLFTSGIASKVGFDIEDVEDIKVAVSEVCSRIIVVLQESCSDLGIEFTMKEEGLTATFYCKDLINKDIFDEDIGILSQSIIEALMDEVELNSQCEKILSMTKYLRKAS